MPVQDRTSKLPLSLVDWICCSIVTACWMILGFKTGGCIVGNLDNRSAASPQMFQIALSLSALVFLVLTGPELVVNWINWKRRPIIRDGNIFKVALNITIDSIVQSPTKLLITFTFFDLIDTVEFLDPLFTSHSKLVLSYFSENFIFSVAIIYTILLPLIVLTLVVRNRHFDNTDPTNTQYINYAKYGNKEN